MYLCKNAYRYEGTLKTHVIVSHCKSNSYNCNQCEYHRSSIDASVKTQTTMGTKSDKDNRAEKLQTTFNQQGEYLKPHLPAQVYKMEILELT